MTPTTSDTPTICPHDTVRALGGGWCVLCSGAQPLPADEEYAAALAALEDEERAASTELAQLDADAAFLNLGEFVRQGWHVIAPEELEWNWHHEALCVNVQAMLDEWLRTKDDKTLAMRWQKLLINICPSSLKSKIIMVFAVAWMWLHAPGWKVLCVSANPQNVTRDAEECRDLITSLWYRQTFGVTWKIREDIDSKTKYATTAGGSRISKGLTAKFTGIHVDCVLLDDPDDAHDVYSESERAKRAGKIETISSRANDKRRLLMLMCQQRVHVDDGTGDALAHGGWLHASYPLQYSARGRCDSPFFTDPRTIEGEILHPARFTAEVIAAAKLELGTFGFEAQYNQNPAPLEGGMLKRSWLRFFRVQGQSVGLCARPLGCTNMEPLILERDDRGNIKLDALSITVDATFGTTKETSSAVGLLVVGCLGPKRFVFMDRTKVRTFIETKQAIRELLAEYPAATRVLVEKKANGNAIIEEMSQEFSGLIGLEADGSKESRAAAMSPAVESGCWYFLDGEPWLDECIAEITLFPNAKRDDRMDSLSQLAAYFREDTDVQRLEAKIAAFKTLANTRRFGRR